MANLSVPHLLGIKHLKPDDIELIFNTADHFKEVINRPIKKVPSLRDITIANLFFENSTRTRNSFSLAAKRLGADTVEFSSAGSSVAKGETFVDTAKTMRNAVQNGASVASMIITTDALVRTDQMDDWERDYERQQAEKKEAAS